MRIWYAVAILISITFYSYSYNERNIKIDPCKEEWKILVDSSINLIRSTDSASYRILINNCYNIQFMLGTISTTIPPHSILINTEDMAKNSVNDIASLLVHESYHLEIYNSGKKMDPGEEELLCYQKEYDFLTKLPTVEDWLFIHVVKQIIYYQTINATREK